MASYTSSDDSDYAVMLPRAKYNDVIDGQYALLEVIGKGTSGEVWRATRLSSEKAVAVKILHSLGKSMKVSHVQYITDMLSHSPLPLADTFVTILDTATHLQRECLVFELYGPSLRNILGKNYLFPLPNFHCSAILWQVCKAMTFLHSLEIAHTDIKPENILLVDDSTTLIQHINVDGRFFDKRVLRNIEVKIIDLEDSVLRPNNCDRWNRAVGCYAPEVYGTAGWGYGVDVFAIGCLAFELYTGIPILPSVNNVREYFYCFERCLGALNASQAQDINTAHPGLFRIVSRVSRSDTGALNHRRRVALYRSVSEILWEKENSLSKDGVKEFIVQCTRADPNRRLKMKLTLSQPLFSCYTKHQTVNNEST